MQVSPVKYQVSPNLGPESGVITEYGPVDQEIDLMNEGYFHEMLYLEKKRSERSGKPLLVMLLDVKEFCQGMERVDTMNKIVSAISSATRETDIRGWYEHNFLLGIILTELGETNINLAKERILNKVKLYMSKVLKTQQLNSMEITFQYTPEKKSNPRNVYSPLNLKSGSNGIGTQSAPRYMARILFGMVRQRWLLLVVDLLLIVCSQLLSIWLRSGELVDIFSTHPVVLAVTLVLNAATLYTLDLYNVARAFHSREVILRTGIAALLGGGIAAMVFYLGTEGIYGRWLVPIQVLVLWGLTLGWRMIYGSLFQVTSPKIPAVILGAGGSGRAAKKLLTADFSPYDVKGFLDDDTGKQGLNIDGLAVLGSLDQLSDVTEKMGIKAAIVAITHNRPQRLTRKILESRLQGLEILEMPTVYERLTGRIPVQHIQDRWLVFSEGFDLLSKEYVQKLKRIFDFAASGVLLVCSAPLMALTALAIRLESPGPILYQQERIGKDGRVFTVFKFRSMCVDAERHGATWAQQRDPRVTRVGRWIRLFHIDELPQIWNVFVGDMSLVGPRPERPEFVRELEGKIPYYCVRHTVAPGITGWAQVKYPYGASLEDAQLKLEYDVYYIKNMSIVLDCKILLRTVGVVLLGEGAR